MRRIGPRLYCVALLLPATGCLSLGAREVAQTSDSTEKAKLEREAKPAPTPRINAQTYLAAGQMLEKQGDLVGAVAQYERAVSAEPRRAQAYNRLAVLYQKAGRLGDAEQILHRGLEAVPDSAMLHNNLGYVQLIQQKFEEAERCFRQALLQSPDFKRAHMNLGITLAQVGRLDDSAGEFARAVPADVAHYNVAVICLRKGQSAEAEKSLRRALDINPDCPGAREQLDRLTELARAKQDIKPNSAATITDPLAGSPEDEAGRVP